MPRTQTDSHAAGFIRGRMAHLREIKYRLDNNRETYGQTALVELLWEVNRAQLSIQANIRSVTDIEARQLLREYIALAASIHDEAIGLLEREPGIAHPEAPFRLAIPERSGEPLKKKKKKEGGQLHLDYRMFDEPRSENEWHEYASDNEEPMSIAAMSAVYVRDDTPLIQPEVLREAIVFAQNVRNEKISEAARTRPNENISKTERYGYNHGYSREESEYERNHWARVSERERRERQRREEENERFWNQPGPSRARTVSSAMSVMLDPEDPGLIGRAEFFTTVVEYYEKCPICGLFHKVYRCEKFWAATLQQRWYWALLYVYGLCINCLFTKHSSFTCAQDGACVRCGRRHNSLLCPRHPDQRDHDRA